MDLFNGASEQIKGKIDFRHAFLDFSQLVVTNSTGGETGKTCPAAMGFAFAAGTTDGPGAFDFKQGDDKVISDYYTLWLMLTHNLWLSQSQMLLFAYCFFLIVCQGNPFWRLVRNLLRTPSKEQVDCQKPKPILLDTGEMKLPYDWAVSRCLSISHLSVLLSLL